MASRNPVSDVPERASRRVVRQQQLLDAAAELLVDKGFAGFNMEALAARASVSKALPYKHFANADAVLIALYERETQALAVTVIDAVRHLDPGDATMRAAVRAYFRVVETRGTLLALLAAGSSPVPDLLSEGRQTPQLVVGLVEHAYRLRGRRALVLASMIVGIVTGASDSWGRGDASFAVARRLAEDAVIAASHAVLDRT